VFPNLALLEQHAIERHRGDHVGVHHDLHAERTRTLLSWTHDIRGQDPQNRQLGRSQHKNWVCRSSLLCTLQRMEANASLGHTLLNDAKFLIPLVYCRWDEWVPAARLLKYNETNLELAKTLKNASTASTSKSANKSECLGLRYRTTRLIFSAREWHWRGHWYRRDRFFSTERWSWHEEGTGRGRYEQET